jgi:Gti1/Pac2 family transcription factor
MYPLSELDATYYGFIGSTYDALILFEACIAGQVKHVSRRPRDSERECVIQSGRIFIYEENTSGIKRWTDGISWSPSRILGNFLIYRQLVKAFGPGQKKKAIKKSKATPSGISKNNANNNNNSRNKETLFQAVNNVQVTGGNYGRAGTIKMETERALIGSLTDSYDFLEDGLVKKTISVNYGDATHHLVSYYTISDAISQKFIVPSKDPRFAGTYPRMSLLTSQNFRTPIEDIDTIDRSTYPLERYEITKPSFLQHQIPMMPVLHTYLSNGGTANKLHNSDNAMPLTSTTPYHGLPGFASTVRYPNQHINAAGHYPAPQRPEPYQGDYRQHLVVAASSNSEGSRAAIPPTENIQRDTSSFHQRGSEDSGVLMFMNKIVNDSASRHNHNSFYGFPRDIILTTNSIAAQKNLPSSSQADFACHVSYEESLSTGQKHRVAISLDEKGMWQIGNASVGHGHYQNV